MVLAIPEPASHNHNLIHTLWGYQTPSDTVRYADA